MDRRTFPRPNSAVSRWPHMRPRQRWAWYAYSVLAALVSFAGAAALVSRSGGWVVPVIVFAAAWLIVASSLIDLVRDPVEGWKRSVRKSVILFGLAAVTYLIVFGVLATRSPHGR